MIYNNSNVLSEKGVCAVCKKDSAQNVILKILFP